MANGAEKVTQSKYAANSARERWKAEGARNREGERERERERRSTWPRVANTKFAHTLCTHEWIYLSRYRSYARQAFRDFRKSGEHLAATRLRYRRIVQTLRANLDKCCSKRFSTYRRGCMVNPLRSCAPGHQKKKKKKRNKEKKGKKKGRASTGTNSRILARFDLLSAIIHGEHRPHVGLRSFASCVFAPDPKPNPTTSQIVQELQLPWRNRMLTKPVRSSRTLDV